MSAPLIRSKNFPKEYPSRSIGIGAKLHRATNGKTEVGIDLVPNTLSMNAFRFDALLAVDREKYAPVILAELDRDYLYMLREGATTFWETIIGADDFADAGSLCHGWSALPVYYYEILDPNGN